MDRAGPRVVQIWTKHPNILKLNVKNKFRILYQISYSKHHIYKAIITISTLLRDVCIFVRSFGPSTLKIISKFPEDRIGKLVRPSPSLSLIGALTALELRRQRQKFTKPMREKYRRERNWIGTRLS